MNVIEAYPSRHFLDRLSQRFGILTKSSFDMSLISKKIKFLYDFQFPEKTIVAVLIHKSKITYHAPANDGEKPSVGHEIWALVDGDELTTIFFSRDGKRIINAEFFLQIEKLVDYYKSTNMLKISRKQLQSLVRSPKTQTSKEVEKKEKLDLPTMKIMGDDWYIDYNREVLINASNLEKKMSFDSAFEHLPEDELEKIMAQI